MRRITTIITTLILLIILQPIYPQEDTLFVEGGESLTVSKSTRILTDDIIVKDDGELFVENSWIRLSVRGESVYNASILDHGLLTFLNSTLETLSSSSMIRLSGRGEMFIQNSNVTGFNALYSVDNSSLMIQQGRLEIGYLTASGETFSILDSSMPKGKMRISAEKTRLEKVVADNVYMNVTSSSLKGLRCNQLNATSVRLLHINESFVKNCYLHSQGEIIVSDSTFNTLTFYSSGIAINALTGVAISPRDVRKSKIDWTRAGGPIFAANNTIVQRYWYLKIIVTDLGETGIPAKVVLTDVYGNTLIEGRADVDGVYQTPILAEIINGTKTIFRGNYLVRAEYLNYSTREVPVTLDGNREVPVKFTQNIPLETTTILTVIPAEVRVDEPVKISGYITTGEQGEVVEIMATGPKGATYNTALKTDEDGAFEGEFSPYSEGEWVIYADWIGGGRQGMSTKSRSFTINVLPRPSITALFIRALPIVIIVIGVLAAFAFLALGGLRKGKI